MGQCTCISPGSSSQTSCQVQEVSPPIKLQNNLRQGLEIQLPQKIMLMGFRDYQRLDVQSTVSRYGKADRYVYGEL